MIGSICGDIVGSLYEGHNIKTTEFELFSERSRFTDDTVMTVATMDALVNNKEYAEMYKKWYKKYPHAGYGGSFKIWCNSKNSGPYNSFGNGSSMRVSPVGLWYDSLDETLEAAKQSAEVTHNHPEGIKGAQSTAASIYLVRTGLDKKEIKDYIEEQFGYDLNESVESIRGWYKFDVSCQGSVPQAIICFLESESFEDAIRKAVSIGGDSDTIACIAGGIAEVYYGIPEEIKMECLKRLPDDIRYMVDLFYERVASRYSK